MEFIDDQLLSKVSKRNHQSLDDKCHRMLNALESGTVLMESKNGKWKPLKEDEVMNK